MLMRFYEIITKNDAKFFIWARDDFQARQLLEQKNQTGVKFMRMLFDSVSNAFCVGEQFPNGSETFGVELCVQADWTLGYDAPRGQFVVETIGGMLNWGVVPSQPQPCRRGCQCGGDPVKCLSNVDLVEFGEPGSPQEKRVLVVPTDHHPV